MPANIRPPQPIPGSPLFETYEAAQDWVAQNRPPVPVCFYRHSLTRLVAVEELPPDHPLRQGALIMILGQPKPRDPATGA